tara:strand:- start:11602 stop:12657 length:1056 start_codon:yes stop_codon:yes gene_type:complete
MNLLACDLGGTKIICGIYENNYKKNQPPKLIQKEKYLSKNWDSFDLLLDDFLKKKCKYIKFPEVACFAVAGALKNNSAKITNLNWELNLLKLKSKYDFQKIELINDFAVQIYGISFLKEDQYKIVQAGQKNNSNNNNNNLHAIIGAGTGLGISRGIISKGRIENFSSEGGHMEYSPRTKEEWNLKSWIKKYFKLDRVSCERVISGKGLSNIARWKFDNAKLKDHPFQRTLKLADTSHEVQKDLASEICKLSNSGDLIMNEIEKLWLESYASFIGDIAIHELCFGGLWISGGTAPKHCKFFTSDSFLKHFLNKGRLKDIVMDIPVNVILDEEFGLFSAACRAKMLDPNKSFK